MTNEEEKIYDRFLRFLLERSQRDCEDIHEFQFSTDDCNNLYSAILEDKS